jgi:hypothetical protein
MTHWRWGSGGLRRSRQRVRAVAGRARPRAWLQPRQPRHGDARRGLNATFAAVHALVRARTRKVHWEGSQRCVSHRCTDVRCMLCKCVAHRVRTSSSSRRTRRSKSCACTGRPRRKTRRIRTRSRCAPFPTIVPYPRTCRSRRGAEPSRAERVAVERSRFLWASVLTRAAPRQRRHGRAGKVYLSRSGATMKPLRVAGSCVPVVVSMSTLVLKDHRIGHTIVTFNGLRSGQPRNPPASGLVFDSDVLMMGMANGPA